MTKAFFEKLTHAGQSISTKQSVISNIKVILSSGGLLNADAAVESRTGRSLTDSFFSALPTTVDMSGDNQEQMLQFQQELVRVLTQHEPRIKQILVTGLKTDSQRCRCQLSIEMANEKFEQEFTFNE